MSDITHSYRYAIGLDIGGTNMVAGVIDSRTGTVVARHSIATDALRGPKDGLRRIAELTEHVCTMAQIAPAQAAGIGIGSTGPVDSIRGTIDNPYTLPTWDHLPIVETLTARFDRPVYLLGDCHVAALGEHWQGAGKGTRDMMYMTVGTGIGGGLIMGGKLQRGVGLLAGEIGHTVIDINGPDCYCGARGCLEMLAAGPAIVKQAAENAPGESLLLQLAGGDRGKLTAELVSRAAQQGDSWSQGMMERVAFYLGTGLANAVNLLNPEVIVVGGGVMQSWPIFEPMINETIARRSAIIPFGQVHIVPAMLGLNAGITGAARAILDYLSGSL